jgi:hypothetical protein
MFSASAPSGPAKSVKGPWVQDSKILEQSHVFFTSSALDWPSQVNLRFLTFGLVFLLATSNKGTGHLRMNTSIFFSVSLSCIAAIATLSFAAPALAQGERGMPTGYCTGETVQISGWESDLVRRNKGLEKFHWSAINTVQHYNVVSTPTTQRAPAKPLQPYHNMKPTVVSTWASLKGPVADKTCIAAADNSSRPSVNAHLRSSNAYGQLARPYEASYGNQPAQYGGERSTDNKVSGRVMHY